MKPPLLTTTFATGLLAAKAVLVANRYRVRAIAKGKYLKGFTIRHRSEIPVFLQNELGTVSHTRFILVLQVLNAVSWAKFGEKSTLEFKWNCIKEKIASEEGIEPREVTALLRREANVVFSKKK